MPFFYRLLLKIPPAWLLIALLSLSGTSVLAQTITSFSPSSGLPGSVITLTGTGFTGATGVTINGVPSPGLTVISSTQLTAYIPVGATTGLVKVFTSAASGTSIDAFTVLAPRPDISVAVTPVGPVPLCDAPTLTAKATINAFTPGTGINRQAWAVALQPDNKIIVGGYFDMYDGQTRGGIARLKPNGTIDPTFAPTGTGLNYEVITMALQPDGKVLVAGQFTTYNGRSTPRIARLNADGTLDATFTMGAGPNAAVRALVLQPDGKVLIGGQFNFYNGETRNYVARLNADGTLDATFAATGVGFNAAVWSLALQPDGKVLVGGDFDNYSGTVRNWVARLNADGTLDATFAATGAGLDLSVLTLAPLPNGKVLIGGAFTHYNSTYRGCIARLNADGSLDPTFAPTGYGFSNFVYTITPQSDGKLLVGGAFTLYNSVTQNRLSRLNANGTLDPTFTGTGASSDVRSIAVQSDNKIVAAGSFSRYNEVGPGRLVRLNANGSLHTTAEPVANATYTWTPNSSAGASIMPSSIGYYQATATSGAYSFTSNFVNVTKCLPTITASNPAAELPGSQIELTGTHFTAATTVTFSGVSIPNVVVNSATSLTVTVPSNMAAGNRFIGVTTAEGAAPVNLPFKVLGIYTGPVGSCVASPSVASIGDGMWHYYLSTSGQVILAYKYTGASLGDFAVEVKRADPTVAVRQDATGNYYFDRNYHLIASAGRFDGRTVALRFYGLVSEFNRLQAADPTVALAAFQATQFSDVTEDCEQSNNSAGESRSLAVVGSVVSPTAAWFVAETSVTDHFSEFYFSGNTSGPLPVELTDFIAAPVGESVQLTWQTASERNSARFEVERSRDGAVFQHIGQVPARGASTQTAAYSFTDLQPPMDGLPCYYRLRQVDMDNTATYSPVRTLVLTVASAKLRLLPNPTQRITTLKDALPYATVQVFDALGRTLITTTADAGGTALLELPAGLVTGIYIVRTGTQALRLLVQ